MANGLESQLTPHSSTDGRVVDTENGGGTLETIRHGLEETWGFVGRNKYAAVGVTVAVGAAAAAATIALRGRVELPKPGPGLPTTDELERELARLVRTEVRPATSSVARETLPNATPNAILNVAHQGAGTGEKIVPNLHEEAAHKRNLQLFAPALLGSTDDKIGLLLREPQLEVLANALQHTEMGFWQLTDSANNVTRLQRSTDSFQRATERAMRLAKIDPAVLTEGTPRQLRNAVLKDGRVFEHYSDFQAAFRDMDFDQKAHVLREKLQLAQFEGTMDGFHTAIGMPTSPVSFTSAHRLPTGEFLQPADVEYRNGVTLLDRSVLHEPYGIPAAQSAAWASTKLHQHFLIVARDADEMGLDIHVSATQLQSLADLSPWFDATPKTVARLLDKRAGRYLSDEAAEHAEHLISSYQMNEGAGNFYEIQDRLSINQGLIRELQSNRSPTLGRELFERLRSDETGGRFAQELFGVNNASRARRAFLADTADLKPPEEGWTPAQLLTRDAQVRAKIHKFVHDSSAQAIQDQRKFYRYEESALHESEAKRNSKYVGDYLAQYKYVTP